MKLTVGKKVTSGFVLILMLLVLAVVLGALRIDKLKYLAGVSKKGLEITSFLVEKEVDHLNWLNSLSESMISHTEVTVQLDPHKCPLGIWMYEELGKKNLPPLILAQMEKMEPIHRKLHESAKQIKENHEKFDVTLLSELHARWTDHLTWVVQLYDSVLNETEFSGQTDPTKCKFARWMASYQGNDEEFKASLAQWDIPHRNLHQSAAKIVQAINAGQAQKAKRIFKEETLVNLEDLKQKYQHTLVTFEKKQLKSDRKTSIYQNETLEVLKQMTHEFEVLRKLFDEEVVATAGHAAKDIEGAAESGVKFLSLLGVLATLLGGFLAYVIGRSIVRPVSLISKNLEEISNNVAAASHELSSASTELSSMSSEQASSVEEISSSLEEIEGMVQNNVGHAEEAASLSQTVAEQSELGNVSMKKLEGAMKNILDSNARIEELVKVIGNIAEKTKVMDEIVFQTKLLSFNASVEAERAGEHGRGFAVVAQEVGNLAQMSGKSAREIAEIVNSSIKSAKEITSENKSRVEEGSTMVEQTSKILEKIMESASTVSRGATQVLHASKDQAKGIKQINEAMIQIDKGTQETAATAEETASSSEELSAQAVSLRQTVGRLAQMVTGKETIDEGHEVKNHKAQKIQNVINMPKRNKDIPNVGLAKASSDDDWESL